MKRRATVKSRTHLTGFSSQFGSETLNVRIYRDRKAFVCERELVERDGTSFTMVLPFMELASARDLLTSDPYYPKVRAQVGRVLGTLDKAVREHHGKRAA
jgi:hypothetical protein